MAAHADIRALDALDPPAVARLALEVRADLVVIGPEDPLVAGAADAVRGAGIPCFGPSYLSAQIEGSKAFAKNIMSAAGVQTGEGHLCTTSEQVAAALDRFGPPYVVKNDSLAAGKGVVVTQDRSVALAHARGCDRVVVEEFLDGQEISLFVITDGKSRLPLPLAQDYKRLGDGDTGPNTGGMGAYAPIPWMPTGFVSDVLNSIVDPVLTEMADRNHPFVGLLYVGLVLTDEGPKVLEFNARFGDPEAQVLLPLLRSGLGTLLYAAATGTLASHPPLEWSDASAVSVVIASAGYPEAPRGGDVITGADGPGFIHSGTKLTQSGELVAVGGRALSCTAVAATVAEARTAAYALVDQVSLRGSSYRTDIALPRKREYEFLVTLIREAEVAALG